MSQVPCGKALRSTWKEGLTSLNSAEVELQRGGIYDFIFSFRKQLLRNVLMMGSCPACLPHLKTLKRPPWDAAGASDASFQGNLACCLLCHVERGLNLHVGILRLCTPGRLA